jgi:hypothetical protein
MCSRRRARDASRGRRRVAARRRGARRRERGGAKKHRRRGARSRGRRARGRRVEERRDRRGRGVELWTTRVIDRDVRGVIFRSANAASFVVRLIVRSHECSLARSFARVSSSSSRPVLRFFGSSARFVSYRIVPFRSVPRFSVFLFCSLFRSRILTPPRPRSASSPNLVAASRSPSPSRHRARRRLTTTTTTTTSASTARTRTATPRGAVTTARSDRR